jgi:hypothetical protein
MSRDNVNSYVPPTDADGYRAELVRLKWGSVNGWAAAHGFHARTVHSVLERWAHRDKDPRGDEAKEIMAALRMTLSERRRPKKARKTAKT